jgi:ABC-type transporter Mla MlaB component
MLMNIATRSHLDTIVIELDGPIELSDCPDLGVVLADSIEQSPTTLIDLNRSNGATSAFMAICIEAAQIAKSDHRKFGLLNSSTEFNKLRALFHLETILPTYATIDQAEAA